MLLSWQSGTPTWLSNIMLWYTYAPVLTEWYNYLFLYIVLYYTCPPLSTEWYTCIDRCNNVVYLYHQWYIFILVVKSSLVLGGWKCLNYSVLVVSLYVAQSHSSSPRSEMSLLFSSGCFTVYDTVLRQFFELRQMSLLISAGYLAICGWASVLTS